MAAREPEDLEEDSSHFADEIAEVDGNGARLDPVTREGECNTLTRISAIKAGPPLDLSFWSFLTFLHHGIEEVERHLL